MTDESQERTALQFKQSAERMAQLLTDAPQLEKLVSLSTSLSENEWKYFKIVVPSSSRSYKMIVNVKEQQYCQISSFVQVNELPTDQSDHHIASSFSEGDQVLTFNTVDNSSVYYLGVKGGFCFVDADDMATAMTNSATQAQTFSVQMNFEVSHKGLNDTGVIVLSVVLSFVGACVLVGLIFSALRCMCLWKRYKSTDIDNHTDYHSRSLLRFLFVSTLCCCCVTRLSTQNKTSQGSEEKKSKPKPKQPTSRDDNGALPMVSVVIPSSEETTQAENASVAVSIPPLLHESEEYNVRGEVSLGRNMDRYEPCLSASPISARTAQTMMDGYESAMFELQRATDNDDNSAHNQSESDEEDNFGKSEDQVN